MRKQYDNSFKVTMVELVNSGMKVREVSEEYGIASDLIRRWRREYKEKSGDFTKRKELSQEERELKALRKELREVRMERDILKKAVSIFSKSDK